MKVNGSYTLDATHVEVWPHIFDPAELASLIPGCQRLEQVSPDEYHGTFMMWLSAISGAYETTVRVLEREEPARCRFEGEVTGPTGRVTGTATFWLAENNDQTLLTYEAQGILSGALGTDRPRFVEGVAKTLINQGLDKLNRDLQAERAAATGSVQPASPATPWQRRYGCALSIFQSLLARIRSALRRSTSSSN